MIASPYAASSLGGRTSALEHMLAGVAGVTIDELRILHNVACAISATQGEVVLEPELWPVVADGTEHGCLRKSEVGAAAHESRETFSRRLTLVGAARSTVSHSDARELVHSAGLDAADVDALCVRGVLAVAVHVWRPLKAIDGAVTAAHPAGALGLQVGQGILYDVVAVYSAGEGEEAEETADSKDEPTIVGGMRMSGRWKDSLKGSRGASACKNRSTLR